MGGILTVPLKITGSCYLRVSDQVVFAKISNHSVKPMFKRGLILVSRKSVKRRGRHRESCKSD